MLETGQPITARLFFEFALNFGISSLSRSYAEAYCLLGHCALDAVRIRAALLAYQRAYVKWPKADSIFSLYITILEYKIRDVSFWMF